MTDPKAPRPATSPAPAPAVAGEVNLGDFAAAVGALDEGTTASSGAAAAPAPVTAAPAAAPAATPAATATPVAAAIPATAAAPAAAVPPTPTPTSTPASAAPVSVSATEELPKIPFTLPTPEEMAENQARLAAAPGTAHRDPGADVTVLDKDDRGPIWAPIIGIMAIVLVHVVVLGILMFFGVGGKLLLNGMALIVSGITAVMIHDMFWHSQEAQQASAFSDMADGGIIAIREGFKWKYPWWKFLEIVDFKNDEIRICALGDDGHTFSTRDPFEVIADWEAVTKPIDSVEGLRFYLRYKKDVRESRVKAMINSQISIAGGRNLYGEILKHYDDFSTWLALIFGGEGKISDFEAGLGITVTNPALKKLRLSEASAKKIAESEPKIRAVADGTERLVKAGVRAKQAADIADRTVNGQEKSTVQHQHEYTGVPPGLTMFAPGGDFGAVVRGGGKGGRDKGNNPNNKKGSKQP